MFPCKQRMFIYFIKQEKQHFMQSSILRDNRIKLHFSQDDRSMLTFLAHILEAISSYLFSRKSQSALPVDKHEREKNLLVTE